MVRETAWSKFFFNVEAVRSVTEALGEESNKDLAGRVLQAGLSWTGSGWTTTDESFEGLVQVRGYSPGQF